MDKIATYCDACDTPVTITRFTTQTKTYNVLGVPITIKAISIACPICSDEILDSRVERENLKRAFAKYKKITGISVEEARHEYLKSQAI